MLRPISDIDAIRSARPLPPPLSPRVARAPRRKRRSLWMIGLPLALLAAVVGWVWQNLGLVRRQGLWAAQAYYAVLDPTASFAVAPTGPAPGRSEIPAPDRVLTSLSGAFPRHRVDVICRDQLSIDLPRSLPQEDWNGERFRDFMIVSEPARQGATDIFSLSQSWRDRVTFTRATSPGQTDDPLEHLESAFDGQQQGHRGIALVYAQLAASLGYSARILPLSTTGERIDHTVCEAYVPDLGQWVLIDPTYNVAYRRNGQWMTARDVQSAWRETKDRWGIRAPAPQRRRPRTPPPQDQRVALLGMEIVPLGPAGSLDRQALLAASVTGLNLEAYEYVLYSPRNDFLTNQYPAGHPLRSPRLGLVAGPDASLRPTVCPELEVPDRSTDLYFPIGRTRLDVASVHAGSGSAEVELLLSTDTPNFAHFELRLGDGEWRPSVSDRLHWDISPGRQVLRVRSVNAAGVAGEAATIEVHIAPLRFAVRSL